MENKYEVKATMRVVFINGNWEPIDGIQDINRIIEDYLGKEFMEITRQSYQDYFREDSKIIPLASGLYT